MVQFRIDLLSVCINIFLIIIIVIETKLEPAALTNTTVTPA